MRATSFNLDWRYMAGANGFIDDLNGQTAAAVAAVTLPHDGMILSERSPDVRNGGLTGYYPGGTYTYTKRFFVPEAWAGKDVAFEFEGVYMNAFVYINDDYAGNRPYGYSNFVIPANDLLRYGQDNEIRVVAKAGMEKTSRWYSGGGIYRNVHLYVADPLHIAMNGLRITTPAIGDDAAQAVVDVTVENTGRSVRRLVIRTEVLDAEGRVVDTVESPMTAYSATTNRQRERMTLPQPRLWNCETPYLYQCRVTLLEAGEPVDQSQSAFGVRRLQLDVAHGLRINGEVVNLRGACIHHDNGIIGAVTLERAEERRVEQLKAAGFNCIRSAHNPMSRAMLDACDRLGMLVMDETFDMWTHTKCDNDYGLYFPDWWERDVEAMVHKDFNHPCVILYSAGNEIPEAGTAKGAEWNRKILDKIHSLDDTRFTTNAVNGMLAIMDAMPAVMADIQAERKAEGVEMDSEGSNALNGFLAFMQGDIFDRLMRHPLVAQRTEEIYAGMDIAGMNYMSACYEPHHDQYPHRIILGTETFPAEIPHLWDLVTRNAHVIGDMTWTGYDYLGEAGCGVYYYNGNQNFNAQWPDRAAYIGDIDLVGNRRPISYWREIIFGLRQAPYIAVERVDHYGQPVSGTPWMGKDDIASWTWPGYEGKPARINVFSSSEEVELLLSGVSLGRQPAGKDRQYMATFETVYQPGELVAIGRTGGQEDGRMTLVTAGPAAQLCAQPDRTQLCADGADLSFILVNVLDAQGRFNAYEGKTVSVSVEGAGALQGFGSANPQSEGNYFDTTWPTYDGQVLAVVRAGTQPGDIRVTFSTPGCPDAQVLLTVQ